MFFRFSRYIVQWYIATVSVLSLALPMYLTLMLFIMLTGLALHMASLGLTCRVAAVLSMTHIYLCMYIGTSDRIGCEFYLPFWSLSRIQI